MVDEPAERLLAKIRTFVAEELVDEERALFAALIAPGVAQAYADAEVEGFGLPGWSPEALPQSLAKTLRDQAVRVVGLEP